ncbi:MAG: hypothetical protein V1907_04475 [Candidatus Kerfeldbacteria bacterium]
MKPKSNEPPTVPSSIQKRIRQDILIVRRLLLAARFVHVPRSHYEQRLISQGIEPKFRVSWEKLSEIAENPRWLRGGFSAFMHRLHRLARSDTPEAVRAYHAVSKQAPKTPAEAA